METFYRVRKGSWSCTVIHVRFSEVEYFLNKVVRMAQLQNVLADRLVAAVIKVNAQHADQLAVLLDKQC